MYHPDKGYVSCCRSNDCTFFICCNFVVYIFLVLQLPSLTIFVMYCGKVYSFLTIPLNDGSFYYHIKSYKFCLFLLFCLSLQNKEAKVTFFLHLPTLNFLVGRDFYCSSPTNVVANENLNPPQQFGAGIIWFDTLIFFFRMYLVKLWNEGGKSLV